MIYIIVLNWNGWRDTVECLDSIFELNFKGYRVIICDNSSTDDSVKEIAKFLDSVAKEKIFIDFNKLDESETRKNYHYVDWLHNDEALPNQRNVVTIIQTGENRGYGAGNNVGIRFALRDKNLECIWILNNDVVVEKNSLKNLYEYYLTHSNSGLIGSKLLFYGHVGQIQAIGGKYNKYLATSLHVGEHEEDVGQYDLDSAITKIDYPVGAALFTSKKYLDSVGLLSEEYFLYFEEMDWVLRGQSFGWSIGYCWKSKVFHKEGRSIGSNSNPKYKSYVADYYSLVNRIRFTRKHYKKYIFFVKSGLIIAFINRLKRFQFKRLKIVLKALVM